MPEFTARFRWRPSAATLVAAALVISGFALQGVSQWFLLLTAAGCFGPGVLREVGMLADKDEFQQQADHRAGYHAFLATGILGFALAAFVRSGNRSVADTTDVPTLLLAALWFTWLLSSLVNYWGARVAAARILRVFGTLWLVFAILSNLGAEWTGWAALLLHPLLAAPFFALAWTAGKWPRVTGGLLLAAAVLFFQFFGMFRTSNLGLMTQGVTFILFVGPLLASGIALLFERRE